MATLTPDLTEFKMTQVLSEDTKSKSIAVCGTFDSSNSTKAVIIAEKQPIPSQTIHTLFPSLSHLKLGFQNDVYSQYKAQGPQDIGRLQLTAIYPATDKHIVKYSSQKMYIIKETPLQYRTITRPYIEEQSFSLQWVYNILDGTSERERIIYNSSDEQLGFILLPDLKWDTTDLKSLYLLAIIRQRGIASMRDLTSQHLPLLKFILSKTKEVVHQTYGIHGDQLRFYVHYQPSFYHFHVHVTHLQYEAPGCQVGRAHLLQDIIDNLETINEKFYEKKVLYFMLKEHDELLHKFVN